MKNFFVILLIGLMVVPAVASAEKVKVRWFVGLGAGTDEPVLAPQQEFVAKFNDMQDEIELVLEIVDNNQAYDTLATQIAAGNAPDIVGPVGIRGRDSFKGAWLDLQPLVDKHNYDLSDFDPNLVDFYRIEGEGLLGLPFAIYPSFLFVNKDLFEEADVPIPPQKFGEPYVDADGNEKEWNMDTLRELAMYLTVDGEGNDATMDEFNPEDIVQFGFGEQFTDCRGFGTFFGAGSFVDADGNAQIPEKWLEAWKWFHAAMWKDYFHPNGPDGNSDRLAQGNWFQTGKVAMAHIHLWYAGCCMGALEAAWDVAVVPSYEGNTTAKLHADTFEIMKGTKNPDAAFKVLEYMLGQGSSELLALYGGMPARKSMQGDFFKNFGEEKFPGKEINWQVVIDSMAYADNPSHESWMPSFQEASNRYVEFFTKVRNEADLDVEAEAAKLKEDLQKIFDAAK